MESNENMEMGMSRCVGYSFIHGLMLKGRRDIHRLLLELLPRDPKQSP